MIRVGYSYEEDYQYRTLDNLPVEFDDGKGNIYHVQLAEEEGIKIRLTRKVGYDQMIVEPRMSNSIYIK